TKAFMSIQSLQPTAAAMLVRRSWLSLSAAEAGERVSASGVSSVHTNRLILKDDPTKAEWLLQWDNSSFSLKNPEGQPVFETAVSTGHRLVEIRELYAEDKISLAIPYGSMVFESDPVALAELRAFVAKSLGSEQQRLLRSIAIGLAMLLVAGS